MNKRLEQLLERVAQWPPGAQEDAAATLEFIEASVNADKKLSLEEQEAKLESLREMLRQSIARGGDYSPDDIDLMIEERFGDSRVQGR
jgi:biopolymer transport protein ExbD